MQIRALSLHVPPNAAADYFWDGMWIRPSGSQVSAASLQYVSAAPFLSPLFFFKFKLAVEVYSIRGYVCTIFKERIRPNPNMHSQSTIRQPVYSFNDSVTNSRVPMHCSLRPLLSFVESNYDRRISWCCDNWMLLWAAFTDWHRPQLRGPDEVLR